MLGVSGVAWPYQQVGVNRIRIAAKLVHVHVHGLPSRLAS
jgi:hypothetical protein